jgi:hypothetical protein
MLFEGSEVGFFETQRLDNLVGLQNLSMASLSRELIGKFFFPPRCKPCSVRSLIDQCKLLRIMVGAPGLEPGTR